MKPTLSFYLFIYFFQAGLVQNEPDVPQSHFQIAITDMGFGVKL